MLADGLNINLIVCEGYDENTRSIHRVFNEITTDEKHEATFSLITFINELSEVEEDKNFVLHYFLMIDQSFENGKKRGIYLGASEFHRKISKSSENDSGYVSKNNTFSGMTFEEVPFITEAEYCIEAYMVEGNLEKSAYETLRGKAAQFRQKGKLVSYVTFDVKYPPSKNRIKGIF